MDALLRYTIRFDGLEAANAGRAAESLAQTLRDAEPAIQAKRIRSDAEAMDFGTVLGVVLAAPAIVELAKGITSWLSRSHSSRLTVIDADGTVIVENIGARDASGLAEKLKARHRNR